MLFSELIAGLQVKSKGGNMDVPLTGIAYDSRRVEPGFVFVAVEGFKADGHLFIQDAVNRGAAALVIQKEVPVPGDIPRVRVVDSRKGLALMAARFYGFPCRALQVVGVTGTNGKTTTTHMIRSVYQAAGRPAGLVGTVQNMIGERVLPVSHTTPESVDLQKLLADMVEAGMKTVVMEVSSHALALHRVEGCKFDVAVFTNLSQDHLDFHENMENYLAAKKKLFTRAGTAVVNIGDPHVREIMAACGGRVVTYGVEKEADFIARDLEVGPGGASFTIVGGKEDIRVDLWLTGLFNIYNALAAFTVGVVAGFPYGTIKEGLEAVQGVPGRFELVNKGQDFAVIVDYAHTPDGLHNILLAARELAKGRLITVFGCGGDRDRGKRPIMGRIGVELSDLAVITSDNPRTEDPARIIDDILAGVKKVQGARYEVVPDRRAAIQLAITRAQAGDVVVIAGKGHETYQEINGVRHHFDDREVAGIILEELGGARN